MILFLCCALTGVAQDTLTITLTGDILLDRGVRRQIERWGIDSLFTRGIDSVFVHSDIVIGNLECPATNIHTPAIKQFVFRGNPEWLHNLRHHGITHLNLANNHSVDQRRGGLRNTYDNCLGAGIVPLGAGRNMAEAVQPVMLTKNVWMFATLQLPLENFTYLPDSFSVSQESIDSLCLRISRLRTKEPAAYIIVCPHWGIEHRLEPASWQRRQAHMLIDAGADIIVGHHTHTLQSIENYKGKPIYYSIGNFIFDQAKPVNTKTCLVQIKIVQDEVNVKTIPVIIKQCRPYLQ